MAHLQSGHRSGAGWKVAVVAWPRADSLEDQREVVGGWELRRQAAKNTVYEVTESPAWLREDSPEDQREAPGGRNLQRRRA